MGRTRRRQRRGDYRIFVGAFPQGELAEQLHALRSRYDPATAAVTAPHVTLAGTYWRNGPATVENEADLIERLQSLQSKIAPFDLVLGGVRRFGHRVVYLGVRPSDGLLAARQALLRLAGRDKHRRYTPHLTLAMRPPPEQMDDMVARLQQSEWHTERWAVPIDRLHLMQRGPQDPAWRAIAELALRAA